MEQFKNHIAERVNIPAARQRIIYCGRVLQDYAKLSDYGKDELLVTRTDIGIKNGYCLIFNWEMNVKTICFIFLSQF